MSLTAHYDTCDDAYELTITTGDGWTDVVKDCPCEKPEGPATCTPTED